MQVGALANYVSNDRASLLCLLPVKDDARKFVVPHAPMRK